MIFKKVLGNIRDMDLSNRILEKIELEWFELDKRLLRKLSNQGTEVGITLEGGAHRLKQGDVLYLDHEKIIVVELLMAQAIVIELQTMQEMAQVCYQLGNRHAPIFLEGEAILVPYDPTLVELFKRLNIPVKIENRRLEHALQAGSSHHH